MEISGREFYQNKGQTSLLWIGFRQVHNFNISNCLFCNNDDQSELIVINNVFNVEISGCEFYQNKDQDDLILIDFEQVHNFNIINCLFCNNHAQIKLIGIDNASNVAISGSEFYQNKGQEYLIFSYLSYIFDMDNCSIYDNDI